MAVFDQSIFEPASNERPGIAGMRLPKRPRPKVQGRDGARGIDADDRLQYFSRICWLAPTARCPRGSDPVNGELGRLGRAQAISRRRWLIAIIMCDGASIPVPRSASHHGQRPVPG